MLASQKRSTGFLLLTLSILLCILLSACTTSIATSTPTSSSSNSNGCIDNCTSGSGVQGVKIFVEPDASERVITEAITSATKSIWVEIYLLTNRSVMNALEEAAHRGLEVRVLLEMNPYGEGSISPPEVRDRLKAAGIQVKGTNPDFRYTHSKFMIFDGKTAFVMTSNLTVSALGGSASAANREYGIMDSNGQDVQDVINIFNADWDRKGVQITNPNLVLSPINSRNAFVTLISSAKKTLLVEAEEMLDQKIEQELINATQRGVKVQVVMPPPKDASDSNQKGIDIVKQGGVQVRVDKRLYMHAKVFIVDGQKAFVGSQNISSTSLDKNREVGLLIADAQVIVTLQRTFQQDWSDSQAA
jgi:phosphatidylserine/phosphatidylglycerophosphate/cardiolipin synthase-like enzyme